MPDISSRRHLVLAPLLALAVLVGFATAPAAVAAKPKTCAEQVVDDWYGDGRVDKIYPRECYKQAIRTLPVDVLDYSNAEEDILRALAYARRGQPDPGPSGGPRPTTTNPDDPTDTTGESGEETTATPGVDTSGPSSLPIPLLVLGGLALLLLAAGGAGYLNRRMQARRAGEPPDQS